MATSMTDALPAVPDKAVSYLLTHHDEGWLARVVLVDVDELELYGQVTIRLADGGTTHPGYDSALQQEAAQRINALCHARHVEHPSRILIIAADLLSGLWAIGQMHGVDPDEWRRHSNLPGACLEVALLIDARNRSRTSTRSSCGETSSE